MLFHLCSKIRLYPSAAQETILRRTLNICREVYNSLLHWRKYAWETEHKSVSRHEQQAALPIWKKQFTSDLSPAHPELSAVFSQTLQDVVRRVELAYSAFFRRIEKGDRPGYPRSKSEQQYDSFCYPQRGFTVENNTVTLSKIGVIKAVVHRRVEGILKTCTVRRQGDKWYACLCYEVQKEELTESQEQVGIDVGLSKFATLSNGEFVDNPRFFRKEEKALATAQRKHNKQKKGSKARAKAQKVVRRIHERIRNRRHNFAHQTARKLVNRFGFIAVENLRIKTCKATIALPRA